MLEDAVASIDVRVQAKAGRSSVEVHGTRVVVRVTAAPEGGKANVAVAALLAKRLRLARGRIHLVRGHRVRDKRVRVEGMTAGEVLARLSGSEGA